MIQSWGQAGGVADGVRAPLLRDGAVLPDEVQHRPRATAEAARPGLPGGRPGAGPGVREGPRQQAGDQAPQRPPHDQVHALEGMSARPDSALLLLTCDLRITGAVAEAAA